MKTITDILNEASDELSTLLDEIVSEAVDNVDDDAAEEYADDNGFTVADEEEEESEPLTETQMRHSIMEAYKAGRDAAFDAVKDSVNGVR